jgi:hypothetical protein
MRYWRAEDKIVRSIDQLIKKQQVAPWNSKVDLTE